jgi:hypothetical protein
VAHSEENALLECGSTLLLFGAVVWFGLMQLGTIQLKKLSLNEVKLTLVSQPTVTIDNRMGAYMFYPACLQPCPLSCSILWLFETVRSCIMELCEPFDSATCAGGVGPTSPQIAPANRARKSQIAAMEQCCHVNLALRKGPHA